MTKKLFTLLSLLLIAMLVLAGCGTDETEAPEPTDVPEVSGLYNGMDQAELEAAGYVVIAPGDPVRIGASAALTGPIPEFGLDIKQAYELAVSDINAAGGIMGHTLELDVQDGACDGDAATIVGNGFAADPTILAVAGGTCTGETLGLKPILQEARIPFVSASATNPAITSDETCDVCNRVALSDKLQADVDAAYIYNVLGITEIAIMHDNADYGLGLAELLQTAFELEGGTVISFDGVQVGDTDFRAVLTQVATNSPELIFFGGYIQEGALIASQMKETGLEDAIFFSDDGVYGDAFMGTAGDAAEGAYVSFVAGDDDADANAIFDAAYEAMFGVAPDSQGPYHAQAYDSVNMIVAAINAVAVEDDAGEGYLIVEREALVSAVRSTSGLQGLAGTMTCNAIGDCGAGGVKIYQVQDGAFVQVSGFGMDE